MRYFISVLNPSEMLTERSSALLADQTYLPCVHLYQPQQPWPPCNPRDDTPHTVSTLPPKRLLMPSFPRPFLEFAQRTARPGKKKAKTQGSSMQNT